ncbi:hypothetical protein LCGC14_1810560 [marine sediment metagenome]|uniref:Uncharacterized protein n=1 Tax=marine sediment metagenome TaxID=412755 RepID=A0A0F9GM31_9ZZZZ
MITFEKEIKVTISGKDYQSLREICELARILISERTQDGKIGDRREEYQNNRAFIDQIFSEL